MPKCMRCRTYFTSGQCPRCEYQSFARNARWRRKYFPYSSGSAQKPGDSEVRQIQAPYRPTDPCE